jgi:methylthioribose-1-phosphate isomerase
MTRPARPSGPLAAWDCLTAGIPLTLLLDLAAGAALDSAAVLHDEEVATLAASAWAEVESAPGSAWARASGA